MFSTNLEPVRICFDDAMITGDEITEILAFLQSGESSDNPSCANKLVEPVDEKKRRRTISNRESAKRSRLRKKKRFEELTEEVNRMNHRNQELKKRLANVVSCGNVLSNENNRLKTESVCLEIRLLELYRFLMAMQSPMISTRVNYITKARDLSLM
ncbi:Basic leucine zipper 4 [Cardamine amara subsp. amara]|uniref:Basic leucine zipper 4 n=1 Tax=Cardamine amara subsp. amara TaxID=228776 RepID=A0ABD1BM44_CARAN